MMNSINEDIFNDLKRFSENLLLNERFIFNRSEYDENLLTSKIEYRLNSGFNLKLIYEIRETYVDFYQTVVKIKCYKNNNGVNVFNKNIILDINKDYILQIVNEVNSFENLIASKIAEKINSLL